jgi:hypothetical protein
MGEVNGAVRAIAIVCSMVAELAFRAKDSDEDIHVCS